MPFLVLKNKLLDGKPIVVREIHFSTASPALSLVLSDEVPVAARLKGKKRAFRDSASRSLVWHFDFSVFASHGCPRL